MKNLIVLTMILLSLASCSKGGDDRIAEQEDIKARQQTSAENDNRRILSKEPENELNEIKYFMKAVEGRFKGSIEISSIPLDIYIEIVPSMEIKFYDRVRTLEEIRTNKEKLSLKIKTLIENPNVPNSGSICVIEGHNPDTKKGLMILIKEGCKNTFRLGLNDDTNPSDITSNNQDYVDLLSGSLSTGVSSTIYNFKLKRQ